MADEAVADRPQAIVSDTLFSVDDRYRFMNMQHPNVPEKLLLAAGLTGYLVLFIITALHGQAPLFDEPLFVPNVRLFEQYGLSRTFLLNIDNQAPGPLYQFVHYALKPITHLQTPGIRLVNTFMLLLIILLLPAIIQKMQRRAKKPMWLPAVHIMAVPMVWQVAGMALTEVPPMLFATLSFWLLQLALERMPKRSWLGYLYGALAGLSLGLAILGRSPFLVIVPAALLLIVESPEARKRRIVVSLYMGVALLCCIPVFVIWGGFMPPKQAMISAGGLVPWHGILAFAYGALIALIIAPGWFIYNRLVLLALIVLYLLLFPLNYYWWHFEYAPLQETIKKIFPAAVLPWYSYLISPALITLALYFLYSAFWQGMERRTEPFFLFILFCTLLMLATCFKVTHLFSSRYVAQVAPLFIILLAPYIRASYWQCARFAAGMIIGLLSLETYFLFR